MPLAVAELPSPEAEAKAKLEAEAKARLEAEAKAKLQAEAEAKSKPETEVTCLARPGAERVQLAAGAADERSLQVRKFWP